MRHGWFLNALLICVPVYLLMPEFLLARSQLRERGFRYNGNGASTSDH